MQTWTMGKEKVGVRVRRFKEKAQDKLTELTVKALMPIRNQEGATIIEILGYALVAVLGIVLIWGLIKGWLPKLFANISGKIDGLS
ncbi:hypothetical protein D3C73_1525250 [compost metagenome]